MRLLVAAPLLLALLAGCTSPPLESAADPTDASVAPPAAAWKSTPVSGEFTTTAGLAFGATGAIQTVAVPSNAKRVFFNLTLTETSPTGTNVRFDPPSCTDSSGCNPSVATSGGKVSFEVEGDVESGDWTVSFFAMVPGPAQTGSYTGEVNALVQPKAPKA